MRSHHTLTCGLSYTMATQSGYASFCQNKSPLYLVSYPNILITQTDSNRKTHHVKYVRVNQQPDIYFKDATHAENQLAICFIIYIIIIKKKNTCLPDTELSCVFLLYLRRHVMCDSSWQWRGRKWPLLGFACSKHCVTCDGTMKYDRFQLHQEQMLMIYFKCWVLCTAHEPPCILDSLH